MHKLPGSTRKYIRREKAAIRRTFSDTAEAEKRVRELIERFAAKRGLKKEVAA